MTNGSIKARQLLTKLAQASQDAAQGTLADYGVVSSVTGDLVAVRLISDTTDGAQLFARTAGPVLAIGDPVVMLPMSGGGYVASKIGGQLTQAEVSGLVAALAAKQPLAANLTSFAGLSGAANKFPIFTAPNVTGLADVSAAALTVLDDASVSAMRATLGLAIGANVQAWSALLDALDALATAGFLVKTGASAFGRRTLTGTTNQIAVSNGSGSAGDPVFSLASPLTTPGSVQVTGGLTANDLTSLNTLSVLGNTTIDGTLQMSNDVTILTGHDAIFKDAGAATTFVIEGGSGVAYFGTISTSTPSLRAGSGTPEGNVSAAKGSVYLQTNGDSGIMLWFKAGNTASTGGWVNASGFVRKFWLSGVHADASAATLSVVGMPAWTPSGTASLNVTSEGSFIQYLTGSVSGNEAGLTAPASYRRDWGIEFNAHVRTNAISSIRLWVGLSDGNPSASNAPVNNFAMFRFSTGAGASGPDTNWHCRCGDGAVSSGADSGVAVAATTDYFLRMVLNSGAARFYINDVFVSELTANLPTATTILAPWVKATTLTSAGRAIMLGYVNIASQ